MQIKRYEAATVQDALIKIRQDLGEDAVLLATKRLRGGKNPLIEVTAARDDRDGLAPPAPNDAEKRASGAAGPRSDIDARLDELMILVQGIRREDSLRGEVAELKTTLNTFFDLLGLRGADMGRLGGLYYHLTANGVSDEGVNKLIRHLRRSGLERDEERADPLQAVENLIKVSIPVSRQEPGKKAMAFIGPTGVGKTTTLAKLAAHYALGRKMKVGLITTDTYRIAAVEQLKVYGKIMRLPVEVAADRAAFGKALHRFADKEAILVDTPGRSQRDENHLRKIREVLRDTPVETHLLLSPTASRENMLEAAERYGIMNYQSVIFTKLDECARFGQIYDVVDRIGKPLSYTTSGQNVPQDIETADPGRIARLIVRNQFN